MDAINLLHLQWHIEFVYTKYNVLNCCHEMLQTRFFNVVDNLPQAVNDTEKLIHSVIQTERAFFKYYHHTMFLL